MLLALYKESDYNEPLANLAFVDFWFCILQLLQDYKSGILQFVSMLKQLQCKNGPISESDNLVYTTLQNYCIFEK